MKNNDQLPDGVSYASYKIRYLFYLHMLVRQTTPYELPRIAFSLSRLLNFIQKFQVTQKVKYMTVKKESVYVMSLQIPVWFIVLKIEPRFWLYTIKIN